jgi:hypothetical protein
MWLFGMYCLALLTLTPYIVGFAIVERLRGWLRGAAGLALLTLCTFLPFWLTGPAIHRANQHSPDAGGYLVIGAMMMVVPLLIEAIAGMVSSAVQGWKRGKAIAPEATT